MSQQQTFKHYILTRFNLGLYSDNPHKIADPDEWMQHRIDLFNKYCVPSIKAQTNQNFTWIIAFDGQTKMKYIEPYCFDNVVVCAVFPQLYMKEQTPEADWIITSRFDNDDMYLPYFVDDIQKAFRYQTEIIDIDYRAMDMKSGKQFTSNRIKANSPFLSLCEPWGESITTALGRPHSDMPNYYEARKLPGYHAIQLLHERNICNRINGMPI